MADEAATPICPRCGTEVRVEIATFHDPLDAVRVITGLQRAGVRCTVVEGLQTLPTGVDVLAIMGMASRTPSRTVFVYVGDLEHARPVLDEIHTGAGGVLVDVNEPFCPDCQNRLAGDEEKCGECGAALRWVDVTNPEGGADTTTAHPDLALHREPNRENMSDESYRPPHFDSKDRSWLFWLIVTVVTVIAVVILLRQP